MTETQNQPNQPITPSKFAHALLERLNSIKSKIRPDDLSRLTVSQTVSFFALVYEKLRNAVEYREEHLIRRAAIERITRRRLMINPEGKGEAENILRELLWARYFDNGSLGGQDVAVIQSIIDKYLMTRKLIIVGRDPQTQQYLSQFIIDLLTCEIEETLNPEGTTRNASFTYFIYQVLRKKIKIEGLSENQKDAFFLAALEKAYRRSDSSYQRFHLFTTFYKQIGQLTEEEIHALSANLPAVFKKVDDVIASPYVDNLMRFTRKQLPPFLILFEIIKKKPNDLVNILKNKTLLWNEVDVTCREKYQQINKRLRLLAVRSFIYIFLTKMLFALILEYPVSMYLYNEVNIISIGINSIFPPILMLLIISFFRPLGEDNTQKIYQRLIEIIDADKSFETTVSFMPKKLATKKPILIFGFTIFYSFTFLVTLTVIYEILTYANFNLISQFIFVFFVSVVTFFSYRIKQIVNEYRLEIKENILTPITDFFFMPVLSLGKFFSGGLAKLNFFILIFDFLIEAPFKFVFEIVEEWITFVRKRKEEII
jgi:hypothetical protein